VIQPRPPRAGRVARGSPSLGDVADTPGHSPKSGGPGTGHPGELLPGPDRADADGHGRGAVGRGRPPRL